MKTSIWKRHRVTKYRQLLYILYLHKPHNILHIVLHSPRRVFHANSIGLRFVDYGLWNIYYFICFWSYSIILSYKHHRRRTNRSGNNSVATQYNPHTQTHLLYYYVYFSTSIYWLSCEQYNIGYAIYICNALLRAKRLCGRKVKFETCDETSGCLYCYTYNIYIYYILLYTIYARVCVCRGRVGSVAHLELSIVIATKARVTAEKVPPVIMFRVDAARILYYECL